MRKTRWWVTAVTTSLVAAALSPLATTASAEDATGPGAPPIPPDPMPAADEPLNLLADELRLAHLVLKTSQPHRLAVSDEGLERLVVPRGVVADDGVRGVEYGARRPVVRLQAHDLGARKVAVEA